MTAATNWRLSIPSPGKIARSLLNGSLIASLRVKLALLALVVLIPTASLLVYVTLLERGSQIGEVKTRILHAARLAAAEEVQAIQATRLLLQALARTPEVLGKTPTTACSEMLARQIKLHQPYYNLGGGVVGRDGVRFCYVVQPLNHVNLTDRSYIRDALEKREFSIGEYQIGRSTGQREIGLGFPVIDEGKQVKGVVYASTSQAWLEESLTRNQLSEDTVLTLIDRNGLVLARHPDSAALTGKLIRPAELLALGELGNEGIGRE